MEQEYIGRDEWGARHPAGSSSRPLPCSEAWLHHTVTKQLAGDATLEQEYAQMRVVEAIGQQRFGRGFSYNLAGFPSGRMYVGCGVRRLGSHTGGHNTKALGVVLVGNYDVNPVPQLLLDSLVRLLRDAESEGWVAEGQFTGGHRDLRATGCPGQFAYDYLPRLNAWARGAPDVRPTPTPSPEVQEDDMYALLETTDTGRLYAYSGARLFHIQTMDTFWSLVRLGSFRELDARGNVVSRKVSQADVDRAVAAHSA